MLMLMLKLLMLTDKVTVLIVIASLLKLVLELNQLLIVALAVDVEII